VDPAGGEAGQHALQHQHQRRRTLAVFDVLSLDGEPLLHDPYVVRVPKTRFGRDLGVRKSRWRPRGSSACRSSTECSVGSSSCWSCAVGGSVPRMSRSSCCATSSRCFAARARGRVDDDRDRMVLACGCRKLVGAADLRALAEAAFWCDGTLELCDPPESSCRWAPCASRDRLTGGPRGRTVSAYSRLERSARSSGLERASGRTGGFARIRSRRAKRCSACPDGFPAPTGAGADNRGVRTGCDELGIIQRHEW
jgi:hypothetical protein